MRTIRRLFSRWSGQAPQVVERLQALILEIRRDFPFGWGNGPPGEAEEGPLQSLWEHATSWRVIWAQRNERTIPVFEAVNLSLQGAPAWL
ncbi:hypothetical protein [Limnochorda pilosa]|uniref:hypothetical protein n=1 Tax=Limnochorda pilosa TaxID=1555112 RepID=UPI0011876F38|nr:hypothetical protein [Limnochorda pilosa]